MTALRLVQQNETPPPRAGWRWRRWHNWAISGAVVLGLLYVTDGKIRDFLRLPYIDLVGIITGGATAALVARQDAGR